MKENKEKTEEWQDQRGRWETWRLRVMWNPGLHPKKAKDINGKTGKIWIKSGVQLIVMYQCGFLRLMYHRNVKMITWEEAWLRTIENLLNYLSKFSVHPTLFQNKTCNKKKKKKTPEKLVYKSYLGTNLWLPGVWGAWGKGQLRSCGWTWPHCYI